MALQVWLPLNGNGNLNNQGLANVELTSDGITYDNGILGKSATFSTSCIGIKNTPITGNITDFSFAFWMKNTDPSAVACLYNGRTSTGGPCSIFVYDAALRFDDGAQHPDLYTVPKNKWEHYCFTRNSKEINLYVNGELIRTVSSTSFVCNVTNATIGVSSVNTIKGNFNYFKGQLNDYRIYDHCLSPREVKEISKGLMCHYPLNDIYATSSINKYSGETAIGKCSHGNFTMTKLTDELGYKYTLNYTGTGTNNWKSIGFHTISYEVGKTYDYSCKVRCNSANLNIYMRAARCCNDWMANSINIANSDGIWHEYHLRQTMTGATFLRNGIECTIAPELEFYTENMSVDGTIYEADLDIKDVQISECTTIYDCSGFKNHGEVFDYVQPSLFNNSPRYDKCYQFDGNQQYVKCGQNLMFQGALALTINIWAYMDNWTNFHSRLFSCTEAGGYNIEFDNNLLKFICNVYTKSDYSTYSYDGSSIKLADISSGWHMITCVYDASVGISIYLDGKLYENKKYVSYGIHYNNAPLFLAAEATGNQYFPTSPYFNGKLSDFRIYATALSDADILELYNSPILITNSGTLMTQGEFKEG